MAKKSLIARDAKRANLIKKYEGKRKALKELIRSPETSFEAKEDVQIQLQVAKRLQ